MSQTTQLLSTLKLYIKAKGMTYKDLAREMNLSLTSIKRLFSQESFTMKRLEAVCRILDLELFDLVMMDKKRRFQGEQKLTWEQETALAEDEHFLFFFFFLVQGFTVFDILTEYQYTEQQARDYLIRLDKLGLIELHANNQVRVLVASNIFWNHDGPLSRSNKTTFMTDLMNHPFDRPNQRLGYYPGILTGDSYKIILRKVDELLAQFNELAEMDANLPLKNRRSVGLMVGLRPWYYRKMAELRRKPGTRE
ncbi:MAG: helix-turn-helix transcriptional regulator [Desulfatibacillum sp.]|nr:helix-turn-helix transcriptional regulator [Desulfatibacillum sp.]